MISRTSAAWISNWLCKVVPLVSLPYSCSSKLTELDTNFDERNLPDISNFEALIRRLREDKLQPESLIKILQGTSDVDSAFKIFKWAGLQTRFNHNIHTYYWMILKLGIFDYLNDMETVCMNMISENCPGAEKVVITLFDTFVKRDKLVAAKRILCIMSSSCLNPSIGVFNNLLGAFAKRKDFPEVVFVYKEMVKVGVAPDVETCNYLIEVLFATGRYDSALDQYKRMNRKGWIPNVRTFQVVMEGLIANGQVDHSIITLNEMLSVGLKPDLHFYTRVIPLYCVSNKPEVSKRLFMMIKYSKVRPDSVIFESLLQCFCNSYWLDDVVEVLEQMVACGLKPSSQVVTKCVNSFFETGNQHVAFKFLTDHNILETSPFNALLAAFCSSDKYSDAWKVLRYMTKMNIADTDSYTILIRWLCEQKEVRKASNLLAQMVVSSRIPNAATYSALVVAHCKSYNYNRALLLVDQLCSKYWVLDTSAYSELMKGLCKVKKSAAAINVFWYMCSNGCYLDSSSFNFFVKSICDDGMLRVAIRITWFASCFGIDIDDRTHLCVLRALSQLASRNHFLAFFSHLLVCGCVLDGKAYGSMLQGMTNFGQIKFAAQIFNKMINEDILPDPNILYVFLSCLENRTSLSLVSAAIDRLIVNHEVLDSAMYNLLTVGYLKEGDSNKALKMLDLMLEKGWVPDTKTHELIISYGKIPVNLGDRCGIHDDVDDILAEGLSSS